MRKRHSRNLNMDMVPMVPGLYQQNGGGAAKDEKPRQELHPNNPFREPFPVAERRSAGAGGGGGGGDGNGLSREHNKPSASPAVSINEQWSMVGQIMQSFQANLPAYQNLARVNNDQSFAQLPDVKKVMELEDKLESLKKEHSKKVKEILQSWEADKEKVTKENEDLKSTIKRIESERNLSNLAKDRMNENLVELAAKYERAKTELQSRDFQLETDKSENMLMEAKMNNIRASHESIETQIKNLQLEITFMESETEFAIRLHKMFLAELDNHDSTIKDLAEKLAASEAVRGRLEGDLVRAHAALLNKQRPPPTKQVEIFRELAKLRAENKLLLEFNANYKSEKENHFQTVSKLTNEIIRLNEHIPTFKEWLAANGSKTTDIAEILNENKAAFPTSDSDVSNLLESKENQERLAILTQNELEILTQIEQQSNQNSPAEEERNSSFHIIPPFEEFKKKNYGKEHSSQASDKSDSAEMGIDDGQANPMGAVGNKSPHASSTQEDMALLNDGLDEDLAKMPQITMAQPRASQLLNDDFDHHESPLKVLSVEDLVCEPTSTSSTVTSGVNLNDSFIDGILDKVEEDRKGDLLSEDTDKIQKPVAFSSYSETSENADHFSGAFPEPEIVSFSQLAKKMKKAEAQGKPKSSPSPYNFQKDVHRTSQEEIDNDDEILAANSANILMDRDSDEESEVIQVYELKKITPNTGSNANPAHVQGSGGKGRSSQVKRKRTASQGRPKKLTQSKATIRDVPDMSDDSD